MKRTTTIKINGRLCIDISYISGEGDLVEHVQGDRDFYSSFKCGSESSLRVSDSEYFRLDSLTGLASCLP